VTTSNFVRVSWGELKVAKIYKEKRTRESMNKLNDRQQEKEERNEAAAHRK
jgi:hypothetical protein